MKERLLLVLNPVAGGGASTEAVLEVVRQLREQGHPIDVEATSEVGQARRIAASRAADYDRVAACGGDGTISEVAAGLLDSGAGKPLVVVPAGTANDFAAAIGAGALPEEALRLAFEGRLAPLDVGFAGETPFVNAASAGVAAEISEGASAELKAAIGPLAYLASGLSRLGSLHGFEGAIEGAEGRYEGPVLFFAVANGQTVGGGTRVAPEALVDDGLLDLVILPALPASSLIGALRALRAGTQHPGLVRMRGERFSMEADREVTITCDGEPVRSSAIDFHVAPGALSLVVHGPAPARRWSGEVAQGESR
ncbi:diacylglycerol/lipid kinase family protein [Vulgatibacter sp.]|uniref:diacylglycerol/lipid kinase family protein n=1 Tax=Vulgatibacter sp. TaxID=1971226 RepID=UPI00356675BD